MLVLAVDTRAEAVAVDHGPFHEGAHDAAGSWHE